MNALSPFLIRLAQQNPALAQGISAAMQSNNAPPSIGSLGASGRYQTIQDLAKNGPPDITVPSAIPKKGNQFLGSLLGTGGSLPGTMNNGPIPGLPIDSFTGGAISALSK